MNKFTVELTSEQIATLRAILSGIAIDSYEKLPELKESSICIMNSLLNAKRCEKVETTKEECYFPKFNISKKDTLKPYVPDKFFDTFNLYAEDTNDTFFIEDEENLRFICGKQGQIGIESWNYYDEDKKPDTVIFINNSDARALLDIINKTTLDFNYNRCEYLKVKEEINDKYEFRLTNNVHGAVATLCKMTKTGNADVIKFYNERQIILFYEFLKYHVG